MTYKLRVLCVAFVYATNHVVGRSHRMQLCRARTAIVKRKAPCKSLHFYVYVQVPPTGMYGHRRESLIILYCTAEKSSRCAQWKIISCDININENQHVHYNNKEQSLFPFYTNHVLLFCCSPITQPKLIFKCFFHARYKLSPHCHLQLADKKSLETCSLLVLSDSPTSCVLCISGCTQLFWNKLWQTHDATILLQTLHAIKLLHLTWKTSSSGIT